MLNEYVQNGLYADYMNRLASCLTREYLSLGSSAMTVQEVNNLMKITITNLQTIRGFFGNSQSEVLRWGMLILSYLPAGISGYVRRVLNRPAQPPVADIPDEFQLVIQIIIKTLHMHKTDEVIPLIFDESALN